MNKYLSALVLSVSTLLISYAQPCRYVVLISIDGFHKDMYLDSRWPVPNLRHLMKDDTYADHLKSVFFDFTMANPIGQNILDTSMQLTNGMGYDHSFLNPAFAKLTQ